MRSSTVYAISSKSKSIRNLFYQFLFRRFSLSICSVSKHLIFKVFSERGFLFVGHKGTVCGWLCFQFVFKIATRLGLSNWLRNHLKNIDVMNTVLVKATILQNTFNTVSLGLAYIF